MFVQLKSVTESQETRNYTLKLILKCRFITLQAQDKFKPTRQMKEIS